MAGRRSARSDDRGGDGIQAPRRLRARLILGTAAVGGCSALAAYAAAAAPRLGLALGIAGVVAAVVLAAALLLRLPALIAPALALLGAEYAGLVILGGDTIDVRAPLYGAAFLVVAELAFGALELRAGVPEPGLVARRTATLVVVALGSVVAGAVALAAAAVPVGGGIGLEAVGVAAAVVLLVTLGRIAVGSR